MNKNIAILSGANGRVADEIAKSLRANQINPVFVKFIAPSSEYWRRLNLRTIEIADRLGKDVVPRALLFSYFEGAHEASECETFFPALQRCVIPSELFKDINKKRQLISFIIDSFKSDLAISTAINLKRRFSHLKLPLRNCGLPKIRQSFVGVYRGTSSDVSRGIVKHANIMKGNRGIRIGAMNFKPVVNDTTHPVRRVCDDPVCDLGARFRFGVSVAERLEYDVSSDISLAGKTFCLCDGRRKVISNQATHLNMRVNDDFAEG